MSGIAKAINDDATALYGEIATYIFSLYEKEQRQATMSYYAHSPKRDKNVPPQPYEDHINGVYRRADAAVRAILPFAKKDGKLLRQSVERAALLHDLGKLDPKNQKILSGKENAKKLPVLHTDAGTAYFLNDNHLALYSAVVIQAHHIGYPDFIDETKKEEQIFRSLAVAEHTDQTLDELIKIHKQCVNGGDLSPLNGEVVGNALLFYRLLLSCLADADHTDTAIHYKEQNEPPELIPLRPDKRLVKLDEFIKTLGKKEKFSPKVKERSELRSEMYESCRNAGISDNIVSCDSPVGSGKTTAVMAHLLAQAVQRNLRRIFVVLPFTNIITQSVDTYRKALTLDGEKPEDVVAELHHRADFQNVEARHLTALWHAPIIVTTAVAFFETLASNTPATLRRLHQLPGSAIFVDESHAALPAKLLPLAWQWIQHFAEDWSCYWALASGSLARFWEVEQIREDAQRKVPELVDNALRQKLAKYENNRISYPKDLTPKTEKELADWITSFDGPRLVIMNTVQSAAVLADYFAKHFGWDKVEHLSTALTPLDRTKTLERLKRRLFYGNHYKEQYKISNDWTLIATSCVEAGMDFSFRTGFRELGSLVSLLQAAGRINREGEFGNAEIWTFCITEGGLMKINPGIKNAARVLSGYFEKKIPITPELSTQSISDELTLYYNNSEFFDLVNYESCRQFPLVEKNFKVINTDTQITVVNRDLAERIEKHDKVDWREVQQNSIQVLKYKLTQCNAEEIIAGVYKWTLTYDDFLGYMAGVLSDEKFRTGESCIV
ncbi:MAG: CRISPR-associated endonuclease Cas3'' [Planctomycetaceae bacterium]|nr:CRISPR-associated endonuclease Cas3'' [Planctomycetaceae bacterium]